MRITKWRLHGTGRWPLPSRGRRCSPGRWPGLVYDGPPALRSRRAQLFVTGMELDAEGTIRDRDADTVQRRRDRLRELGGPPDGVRRP